MANKRIVVVGGGIGGLATAGLLARDGHSVTLLEKNSQLGGRANLLATQGFRFDLGPSWYLMPDVFETFFAQFNTHPSKHLDLREIEPQYRIFFSDKSHVDISRIVAKTRAIFEEIEPGAGAALDQYLVEAQRKYNISVEQVLYKNVDTFFDFFSWKMLKEGRNLNALESMDSYVSKFFKSEKLQQIIQYTLVFLGGSPSNLPALYSLMTHVDFNQGVYYPMGGFYEVVKVIAGLAEEAGARLRTNAPVEKIITDGDRVVGVQVAGRLLKADVVIGNADYVHLEDLLDDQSKRAYSHKYWNKQTLSPSAFLVYLGVKGKLPKLQHHNIYFGENWIEHFDDIFAGKSWPQHPSLYINMPSKTDSSVAPKGHENLMILVPTAAGLRETPLWREQYAQFIIKYVEEQIGIALSEKIVFQKIFSVTDFKQQYNSYKGNALAGSAQTLLQTGIFRANNKHKHLKNLFMAGAYTTPGIGVPPTLISAHLARDRVRAYLNSWV